MLSPRHDCILRVSRWNILEPVYCTWNILEHTVVFFNGNLVPGEHINIGSFCPVGVPASFPKAEKPTVGGFSLRRYKFLYLSLHLGLGLLWGHGAKPSGWRCLGSVPGTLHDVNHGKGPVSICQLLLCLESVPGSALINWRFHLQRADFGPGCQLWCCSLAGLKGCPDLRPDLLYLP